MGLHEDGRRTISYSEISTFQHCERQHELSYRQGLRRNSEDIGASAIGVIVHLAIAEALRWYHANDYRQDEAHIFNVIANATRQWADEHRPKSLPSLDGDDYMTDDSGLTQQQRDFDVAVDEAAAIAYRTVMHLDVPNNWRTEEDANGVPMIEYRIEKPMLWLPNEDVVTFVGYVDWVARDIHSNTIYIVDWKTRKTFQEDETNFLIGEDFNVQLSLYQYVLASQGIPVVGNIIYQISSRLPEIPELTKTGAVSRAKIKTDWETYSNFVLAMGLDVNDYLDVKANLDRVEFWRPVTHYRSSTEVANRWREAQEWADDIISHETSGRYSKKVETVMCRFCPFASICLAEDKGYDVDFVIEQRYNKRIEQAQVEPETE